MPMRDIRIRQSSYGVEISLHVQPRARINGLAGTHNGALKLKVQAPPVDDAANLAVVRFFSELLGIPKSSIRIASGSKSREKTLLIEGISASEFLRLLPEDLD